MLRSDREVALDQVTEIVKKAADEYAALADMTENETLAAARQLEDAVRQLGNLPTGPDPDRETMETFSARLRSALSRDGDQVLKDKRRELESELAGKAETALQHSYPPEVQSLLQEIAEEARSSRARFA